MSILTYLEVLVFFSFIQWDEFLLVEEHFDYAEGLSINGRNGGSGWKSAWENNRTGDALIATNMLGMLSGLTASGNCAKMYAAGANTTSQYTRRTFASNCVDTAGMAYWFALKSLTGGYFKSDQTLYLRQGTTNDIPLLAFKSMGAYTAFPTGAAPVSWTTNGTQLVLFKIEMGGLGVGETVSLYTSPDMTQPSSVWIPRATATLALEGGFDGIAIKSAANATSVTLYYIDEIRLALTWQEAVGKKKTTGTLLLMM